MVDASESARYVVRVHETIPVSSGSLDLVFPKFIPGEHGPTGKLMSMVGFKISANGTSVPWKRDGVDMFRFHLTVPDGASALNVEFQSVSEPGDMFNATLGRIKWDRYLVYPIGPSDDVQVQATLRVPKGWRTACVLSKSGDGFEPVSLTRLIDSPAMIGKFYRSYPLGEDGHPPAILDVMGDTADSVNIPAAKVEGVKRLVDQAVKIGRGQHFNQYRFLLTFSDDAQEGLEHFECSENGVAVNDFNDDPIEFGSLLGHELFHSWNGKFRRPAGLATLNYTDPMQGSLLWVYEGMTEYYGNVLAARAGLISQAEFHDVWAAYYRWAQSHKGRRWRSLEDTAISAQLLYDAPPSWDDVRRDTDYYEEGALIWLEADTIIRKGTGGAKSLDDFVRAFAGGVTEPPKVNPYEYEDVVSTLNEVFAYDWDSFLTKRIKEIAVDAPVGGINGAGFEVVNTSTASLFLGDRNSTSYLDYAIGMKVHETGPIFDIDLDGPAYKAGLSVGDMIRQVNGKPFKLETFEALVAKPGKHTIDLLVASATEYRKVPLTLSGGPIIPHLARTKGQPDLLTAIGTER